MVYASKAHASQLRKGTDIPYISHLLCVTSIVMENGGNEDEAIAALLHDAVEDSGGGERLKDIRNRFGEAVSDIVAGCSDTDVVPKPPWRERKEAYLDHLKDASPSILLVSSADKLHNARTILTDCLQIGDKVYDRFNVGKMETIWYYKSCADAFEGNVPARVVQEIRKTIKEIEKL